MTSSTEKANERPSNQARAEELYAQLDARLGQMRTDKDWLRYLEASKRMWRYSAKNAALILAQKPEATMCMKYRDWQKVGRQVQKGEHGLDIWCHAGTIRVPTDKIGPDGKPVVHLINRWKLGKTFDISQTEGEPIKDYRPQLLKGNAPAALLNGLRTYAAELGYPVQYREDGWNDGTNGFVAKEPIPRIVIHNGRDALQKLSTLTHEVGHVKLGHVDKGMDEYRKHRGLMEVEAQSVAYVVLGVCGLNTDDYSFGYIHGWSKGDPEVIAKTARNVLDASMAILRAVPELAAEMNSKAPAAREQGPELSRGLEVAS